MSQNDDIDRLLREVDANLSGKAAPKQSGTVAPTSSKDVSKSEPNGTGLGVLAKAGIAAGVVGGLVFMATFFLQWLPIIDNPVSSGLGAAVGAFLTALVFGRRRPK